MIFFENWRHYVILWTFTYDVIYFICFDFEFISQLIEKKFLPVMYHVWNDSYAQFECDPPTHSQNYLIYSKCCVSCGIEYIN